MIDATKEVLARVAIAEFEARRLKEKSAGHARRWRLAFAVSRFLLCLGAGVYLQVAHWQISGAQAGGFLLIYLASSVWEKHRTAEILCRLQAELDELKDRIKREKT